MEETIVLCNNPDYIQNNLWHGMVSLADSMDTPGISAHSLMSYFLYGTANKTVTLYAVLDENNECQGFFSFQELGPPYYSTASCTFFYLDNVTPTFKSEKVYPMFEKFCKERGVKYFHFITRLERLGNIFMKGLKETGMIETDKQYLFIGKRQLKE